jgi:hypothetical protein
MGNFEQERLISVADSSTEINGNTRKIKGFQRFVFSSPR